ncbi:hypothetical protein BH11ARM2_BH11ARM2_02000 [soil metagenome]
MARVHRATQGGRGANPSPGSGWSGNSRFLSSDLSNADVMGNGSGAGSSKRTYDAFGRIDTSSGTWSLALGEVGRGGSVGLLPGTIRDSGSLGLEIHNRTAGRRAPERACTDLRTEEQRNLWQKSVCDRSREI